MSQTKSIDKHIIQYSFLKGGKPMSKKKKKLKDKDKNKVDYDKKSKHKDNHDKRPNFLILMVDEQRFPTVYENEALKAWRMENLKTQEYLRQNGMEFLNHYAGSTACSPSRATLYTGQYPSLHGVTQTTGAAKGAFDPDTFWLDANSVPTMGDYFRAAGYRTFWKGKWHISDEDILIPGTHQAFLSYDSKTGVPNEQNEEMYLHADRLDNFGFSGWVGPEPHGSNPRNSASSAGVGTSGRDVVYSKEAVELIKHLEKDLDDDPWLLVTSFVNPHDITLFGEITRHLPTFNFPVDPSVPLIPQSPTAMESLQGKPTAQLSYRDLYSKIFQPTEDSLFYRQLYYSLQKQADEEMFKVFQALRESKFYENTIILFYSDHGDQLGSHGGLFQKWYNAYEESIHVPFIIHSPKLFLGRQTTEMLSSHVDIIPTMLGLAGIDTSKVQKELQKTHTEVHPFVGRNLTPLLFGNTNFERANEALYFMTDDDVSKGLNQVNILGKPYDPVIQPNHIESVITTLETGINRSPEMWKFSRYFDNPQFWTTPNEQDQETSIKSQIPINESTTVTIGLSTTKDQPVPDEFELYNLTTDPLETTNLADPTNATPETMFIQQLLTKLLEEQRHKKRLTPTSGNEEEC